MSEPLSMEERDKIEDMHRVLDLMAALRDSVEAHDKRAGEPQKEDTP